MLADSAAATCEVRKEGETRKGASGPCTFSRHQGYINLDLRNGDTEEFKREGGKKIILTFGGGAGAASSAGPDSFDTLCGVMVNGQNCRYRCGATDFYSGGQKVRTELRYPDQTI